MYYIYILKSRNRNYSYIGTTNNLERRLTEHNSGINKTTRAWKPFVLVYQKEYNILSDARKQEWFLKCTPQGGKLKRKILAMAAVAA